MNGSLIVFITLMGLSLIRISSSAPRDEILEACNDGFRSKILEGLYLKKSSCERDCQAIGYPRSYVDLIQCKCECNIDPELAAKQQKYCICKFDRCEDHHECCSGTCIPKVNQCIPVWSDKCDLCKKYCKSS